MNQDSAKVLGNWMPNNEDREELKSWVDEIIKTVAMPEMTERINRKELRNIENPENPFLHKEVAALKDLIEGDTGLYTLTNQMIDQALHYNIEDPVGNPQITDYNLLLKMIDYIIQTAPEYIATGKKGHSLIGFPINAILNWCMGTPAGYAFFMNREVNQCFKNILNKWCKFLNSRESLYVLNTGDRGWMCDLAKKELNIKEFIYDPLDEHWGFDSWNSFFTRKFKDGARPVADKEDKTVIVSACESAPYRISKNIQKNQKFWLKGQPYSLEHMLNKSKYVDEFVEGTIYQAFLSATKYHRWHSPVKGTIKKTEVVPGTYYSELRSYPYDDAGPNNSQGYITQVATRAIIYIECEEPIGLMCFIAVGMAEVSSCIITVEEGQEVEKGEELGYFQFGGSTHCLLFRKDVIEEFVIDAIPAPDFNDSSIIKVNSKLAVTRK